DPAHLECPSSQHSVRHNRDTGLSRASMARRLALLNDWDTAGQAVAAVVRRCWKHSRQKTGRPCVGLKGTVVSLPQPEQLVRVSTFGRLPVEAAPSVVARLPLQALQRLGSFLNCLSWKNS